MIDYASELNAEQYQVVASGDGPVLVLAGAGSGKTRTITYRVVYLLEHGVPADRILLVTFTNKAAREMMERTENLLGRKLEGFWGGTFHSIAVRILKQHAERLGYQRNFTIMDADDSVNLIKRCIVEVGAGASTKKKFPSPAVIQGVISFARNAERPIADVVDERYEGYALFTDEFEAIAKRYAEKKKEANVMDFDDLLTNLLQLLEAELEVRERLSSQFQYILVDEYQDTNTIQARIVKYLASKHGNVLVVGDDAQSIYSFRAATIDNILSFEKDFPGAKIYRLETNYRSTPDIVSVANCVIKKNKKQFEKSLRAVLPEAVKPKIVPTETPSQEAEFIVERIERLKDGGNDLSKIAVLFRAVHHAQALEFELARRNIPYEMRGGMRFFERSHIKDALAFLRIINNLDDHLAWMRVLSMADGVGPATAQKLLARIREIKSFDELETLGAGALTGRARAGWMQTVEMIRHLLDVPQRTPSELITGVLSSPYYREYAQAQYEQWEDRLEDVEQLGRLATRITDLDAFLAEASLQEQWSDKQKNKNVDAFRSRVVLSTIHQSKGLEWDTVFIVHLLTPGFPNERALREPGGLEEERRLFYVAVTRARHQLYFTYPQTTGKEFAVYEQPSVFLDEIEPTLLDESSGFAHTRRIDVFAKNDDNEIEYVPEDGPSKPDTDWRMKSFLKDIDAF